MEINRTAPAVAASEIEVAASADVVWEVVADLERWPDWNPDITSVSIDGPLARGTRFRWKAGRNTISSTIEDVDPPRSIGWTGKTTGIAAIHVWTFEARTAGTMARSEESWEGLIVRLLGGRMRKMLQESLDVGMPHLKAEAERRAASRSGLG